MAQQQVQKKTSIGGQALIEGVMMRGPEVTAMAVRHVSGEIKLEQWPTGGQNKPQWMKWPFVRGIFNMIDSMRFGYKCLMRSAELSGLGEEEEKDSKGKNKASASDSPSAQTEVSDATVGEDGSQTEQPASEAVDGAEGTNPPAVEQSTAQEPAPAEQADKKQTKNVFEGALFTVLSIVSIVLGVALSFLLFMYLPTLLYSWVKQALPGLDAAKFRWLQSVFEGVVRFILFLGYIMLISLMKDIRRVFMYHGAEHKTIFCYEKGLELTVENVRQQSRFHPRCGTSFLILMLLVGILISMLIPVYNNVPLRVLIKLLVFPVVVGIGYELIKLAGRKDNAFTRIISKPGLWMQRLTTKEPDDGMIECAIAALKPVIPADPEADKW